MNYIFYNDKPDNPFTDYGVHCIDKRNLSDNDLFSREVRPPRSMTSDVSIFPSEDSIPLRRGSDLILPSEDSIPLRRGSDLILPSEYQRKEISRKIRGKEKDSERATYKRCRGGINDPEETRSTSLDSTNLKGIISENGPGTYLLVSCRSTSFDYFSREYKKMLLDPEYSDFSDILDQEAIEKNNLSKFKNPSIAIYRTNINYYKLL